jgi:hypothetical protein
MVLFSFIYVRGRAPPPVAWWCELQLGDPLPITISSYVILHKSMKPDITRQVVENGEWYVLKQYNYRDQPHGATTAGAHH